MEKENLEAKNVERLSYYTTGIALIYLVIGLLSGFWLVYIKATEDSIPDLVVSAHSHFLCMSIIILIVGLAMKNWAREIKEGKFDLSRGRLRSAQASITLLALGNIITFAFLSVEMPKPALVGDILFFIGFLMVAIGWILGGRKIE